MAIYCLCGRSPIDCDRWAIHCPIYAISTYHAHRIGIYTISTWHAHRIAQTHTETPDGASVLLIVFRSQAS